MSTFEIFFLFSIFCVSSATIQEYEITCAATGTYRLDATSIGHAASSILSASISSPRTPRSRARISKTGSTLIYKAALRHYSMHLTTINDTLQWKIYVDGTGKPALWYSINTAIDVLPNRTSPGWRRHVKKQGHNNWPNIQISRFDQERKINQQQAQNITALIHELQQKQLDITQLNTKSQRIIANLTDLVRHYGTELRVIQQRQSQNLNVTLLSTVNDSAINASIYTPVSNDNRVDILWQVVIPIAVIFGLFQFAIIVLIICLCRICGLQAVFVRNSVHKMHRNALQQKADGSVNIEEVSQNDDACDLDAIMEGDEETIIAWNSQDFGDIVSHGTAANEFIMNGIVNEMADAV